MIEVTLTNEQARQFMLIKHGLIDEYKFENKQGIMDYISQVGCIQYDPIDVCGKNAELVLQSRVKGFKKKMLSDLLYEDRELIDFPDKNLSIIKLSDWKYFIRYKKAALRDEEKYEKMHELKAKVYSFIEQNGAVCSNDIDLNLSEDFYWRSSIHWSGGNNVSRSVLEHMYCTGELIIHHKKGTRKYYDIAKKHIEEDILYADEPLEDEFAHQEFRVYRRIGAVGLLGNRASDAWLNIWGLKTDARQRIFSKLLDEEKIIKVQVMGLRNALYCKACDKEILDMVLGDLKLKPRCEFIAPLDNILWDRKIIRELFNFHYQWEIYTPQVQRKFGYYVLPILFGDMFVGRIEVVCNRKEKQLVVKNIWYEENINVTKALKSEIKKHACVLLRLMIVKKM